ncbi:hypothetical protein JT358_10455 [Micrococcales bacterium 31B]|nr:hypothetical protein [Micrococcales bacterium 31B]
MSDFDWPDQAQIDAAWGSLAAQRAQKVEQGPLRALTREEADAILDARKKLSGA